MADEVVDEISDLAAEIFGFIGQLREGLSQAVGDLDIAPAQLAHEFDVVIAGDAQGDAAFDSVHDQFQNLRNLRAAINQVAKKDQLAATGGRHGEIFTVNQMTEGAEKFDQLVEATMNVANDVKWPMLVFQIVPKRLPLDDRSIDFFGRAQNKDVAEPLAFQAAQGTMKLLGLLANNVRSESAIRARLVAVMRDAFGHVKNNGHRQAVKFARERNQRLARLGLDVRGVHDGKFPGRETFAGDEVENLEGVGCRPLVVFVIGHERAAVVGRKNFRGFKVLARKRALAGARDADEDDEGEFWDGDGHFAAFMK
jgi:hypothetical protein